MAAEKEELLPETKLSTDDTAQEEVNKLDQLAERIEKYRQAVELQMKPMVKNHNHWLSLIDGTGLTDPDTDPTTFPPGRLGQIEIWYSMARKEAYGIAGLCKDLQKFYTAVAEQGKATQYERVRMKWYSKLMTTATDAKEIARRVGGRLDEKAAKWEGEATRWKGIGDSYEQASNGVKDIYKIAEWEYTRSRGVGTGR